VVSGSETDFLLQPDKMDELATSIMVAPRVTFLATPDRNVFDFIMALIVSP